MVREASAYGNRLAALAREVALEVAPHLDGSPQDLDLLMTATLHVILETQSDALLSAPQRVLTPRLWAQTVGAQGNVTTVINAALDADPLQEERLKPHLVTLRTRFSPKSQKARSG